MKVLLLANNQKWKSWNTKIQALKDWFKPVDKLDITLTHTNFKSIPFTVIGNGKEIDKVWYDKNIQPLAKGYDIVMFSVPLKQWKGGKIRGRWTRDGVQEIQLGSDENGSYEYNGIKHEGGRWFNIARHEICHALYAIKGLKDNTHKWFDLGNLEEVRNELSSDSTLLLALKRIIAPPTTYKYFNSSEIEGLKPELVKMLDEARGIAGIPFKLNSTLRDTEKNAEVGGVKDSAHIKGLAVDISATTSGERFKILDALLKVGFRRIGLGKTFLHADIDISKPQQVAWHYN